MSVHTFLQLGDPIVITDMNHVVRYINDQYHRLTGFTHEELVGKPVNVIASGITHRSIYENMYRELHVHGTWRGVLTNRHKSGALYHAHCSITKVQDGDEFFYVGISRRLENIVHGAYLSEDQITKWQITMLETVAYIGESDDPYIEEHVSNVRRYTAALSTLFTFKQYPNVLSEVELTNLPLASMLHDIGKSRIPKSILYKPGKLVYAEFELVKTHTAYGKEILDRLKQAQGWNTNVIDLAQQIALSHHEWWNGQGYPHGLLGQQIPISARIVSIADVLDALKSQRTYKLPWSDNDIMNYFKKRRGTQFDPDLVDILLSDYHQIVNS